MASSYFFPLPFSFSFSIPLGILRPGVACTGYHHGGSIQDGDNIAPSWGSWLLNACNIRDIICIVGEASKLVNSPLLFGMLFRGVRNDEEMKELEAAVFIFLDSFYFIYLEFFRNWRIFWRLSKVLSNNSGSFNNTFNSLSYGFFN